MSSESKQVYDNINTSYPSLFDGIGLMVFIGVWILCLVLAFNSVDNRLMLVFGLFIVAMVGVVSMVLSNVWDDVYSDGEMNSYAVSFPMTNFLLSNYLLVVVMMGGSVLIVGLSRGGAF